MAQETEIMRKVLSLGIGCVAALLAAGCDGGSEGDGQDGSGAGGKADDPTMPPAHPRLTLRGSGFDDLADAELRFAFILDLAEGHARSTYTYDALHPRIGADGTVELVTDRPDPPAFKALVFIESNGQPGCQEDDIMASVLVAADQQNVTLEFSPDNLPLAESLEQNLDDCNQEIAPRYSFKVTATGVEEFHHRMMNVVVLPHEGYGRYSQGGSSINPDGIESFRTYEGFSHGYREKFLMFIEADGISGCSEDDLLAAVMTDPVDASTPLEYTFARDALPRTDDPAQDLRDCNKFYGPPYGPYDLVLRGTGFNDRDGQTVTVDFGHEESSPGEDVIEGGAFEVIVPEVLWEAEDENFFAFIDGNADGLCGDPSDAFTFFETGDATADRIIDVTPETWPTLFLPPGVMLPPDWPPPGIPPLPTSHPSCAGM
jgi:hypothetical protein